MTKEKKYVLGILSLVALGAVTLALTTFSTTPKPQPPVEYRAVCRNLPANAHRTSDGSTRKEIPQTETSPNVREPNPVGMFSEMNTDSNQCYFVCNTGYHRESDSNTCNIGAACETQDITLGNYTIASCNVGASEAGTGVASYGNYFQRGNNYGFSATVTSKSDISVNAADKGPGNRYNSDTFITTAPRENSNNTNLRGGQGDTLTTNGQGTGSDRQGPCATGYHVPSALEWWDITCQRLQSFEKDCPVQTARAQFTWDSPATLEQFQNDFLLPLAGEIEDSNGIFKSSTSDRIGAYRSSTRQTNDEAYELYFSASTVATGVQPQRSDNLNWGWSVRCFKNSN